MTKAQKSAFKQQLFDQCVALIEKRLSATVTAMNNAQAAANSEEKSSAGDKYETSRAMNQLEKDMYASQLASNRQELANLQAIPWKQLLPVISAGSVVLCDTVGFFIAAGLGKIMIEGKEILMVSPHAPITHSMAHKTVGDKLLFNKTEIVIREVF